MGTHTAAAMRIIQECCLLLTIYFLQPLIAAPPQASVHAHPEVWRVNLPNLSSTAWNLPSGAATRQSLAAKPNYKLHLQPTVHPARVTGKKHIEDRSVSIANSKISTELRKMIQESSRLRHQNSGVLSVR